MPTDPNAHFDQTVMEMIEHSPVGAVPVTPSYQDALKRLYAAHQVYASADHKGGHVTARSLAKLPSFHANNLDPLIAGQIAAEALESNSSIFDRYVQSLPSARRAAAESRRLVVVGRPVLHRTKGAHDPIHTLFLVPGTGPHPGLAGNYLYGSALQVSADAATSPWTVYLHDGDDGAVIFDASTMPEALAKLQEVLECAPFNMNELEALGFRFK
ncbi:MAG TPA: hypothetical protein VNU49_08485 [Opitutaceae bacterium]|nr:hypothetical protein [Opitutaceae bacterium]